MTQEKPHFFDKPGNVRRVLRLLFLVCALLLTADFVIHRHVTHDWQSLWGFYSVFGFVACISLVLLARLLRKLVMRPEDYYDS